MRKFHEILIDITWYRQFIYGAILVVIFGLPTILAGFSPVWIILQIVLVAGVREHYIQDLVGDFNWRNFYFLQVPSLIFYFTWTAF